MKPIRAILVLCSSETLEANLSILLNNPNSICRSQRFSLVRCDFSSKAIHNNPRETLFISPRLQCSLQQNVMLVAHILFKLTGCIPVTPETIVFWIKFHHHQVYIRRACGCVFRSHGLAASPRLASPLLSLLQYHTVWGRFGWLCVQL